MWQWLTGDPTGQVVLGITENIVAALLCAIPSVVVVARRLHTQRERHHTETLAQAERHHHEQLAAHATTAQLVAALTHESPEVT